MTTSPKDHRGRFVSRRCPLPECGNGTLQFEGDGFWRCDGLADPGHDDIELIACEFAHQDGQPTPPGATEAVTPELERAWQIKLTYPAGEADPTRIVQIERANRQAIAQALREAEANALRRSAYYDTDAERSYTATELKELLDGRDSFIVREGLWDKSIRSLLPKEEGK